MMALFRKKCTAMLLATVIAFAATACGARETAVANGTGGVYASSSGGIRLSTSSDDYVQIDGDRYAGDALIAATDDLGRVVTTAAEAKQSGRQVAMFYCLWHDSDTGPNRFADVLAQDPNPMAPVTQSPWLGSVTYYWGDPLYGFYKTNDTWVLRRHVEMLTYAGIDFLVFDTTNDRPYITEALKLMKILHEYREMGWDTPQVAFYTNTDSVTRMVQIYEGIYALDKYPDTWYLLDGKPLIIGTTQGVPSLITDFFTLRASQWPNSEEKEGGFPWIDFRPQAKVYPDKNGKNKVISVSVAQNAAESSMFGDSVFYGDTDNRGRSYHDGAANITEDSYKYGYNFQEQWDHAIASDADIAMVLEWNEWTAGAYNSGRADRPIAVFDCITPEYSRDIEPMSGGYFDNYYMQLVDNVRRFKGLDAAKAETAHHTIDVTGGFSQWSKVETTYRDFTGGAFRRDAVGIGGTRLIDTSGRNAFVYAKAAQDAEDLYFYVQTEDDITPFDSDGTWMQLYLDLDGKKESGRNGYEYIVNAKAADATQTTVVKTENGGTTEVGRVSYRVSGNQMMIGVPKAMLGITGSDVTLQFKWADSRETLESTEDFYLKGDVMPLGRFNYVFDGQ